MTAEMRMPESIVPSSMQSQSTSVNLMSDKPLRILVVTSMYPTKEEPALGAFVASQVASLQKLGLHCDVLFLDVRASKWELLKGIGRVRNALSSGNYDLIHAHFGYNGIPALMQKRVPFVISYCGTDLNHPKHRLISQWVARRAEACIVKSESLHLLLGHPAHIIPNGVDMAQFRPGNKHDARCRLNLAQDKKVVLFVSTDLSRPEKRYEMAKAAVSHAGCHLLVMSRCTPQEAPLYYHAADALILTSVYEGSPNVIKEALACNVPIVSTDVGDVRSQIRDVHNCQIGDATIEDLSGRLKSVLSDKQPSNGRDKITHLSTEAIARQILGLYRQVLNRRATP
jgi:glycosyltransferase involved in cell wall biosynthesis